MDIEKLDALFAIYGYEIGDKEDNLYRCYLSKRGMYYGAEIIILSPDFNGEKIKKQYAEMGFCSILHNNEKLEEIERYLFKGFFQTSTTKGEINRRYKEFSEKQMRSYRGDDKYLDLKYQYIDSPYEVYTDYGFERPNSSVVDEILKYVEKDGAQLIIVEAAAGYGKTCTAYEIYHSFTQYDDTIKPIFSELTENRDAKLFRYVLTDEIDKEYAQMLNSTIVEHNIKLGRIPLIIDGFDELLSKDIDEGVDYESEFRRVESMLSTIADLLERKAKIILTSRRTAIFAGEEFGQWVEKYNGAFEVVRFQLEKPKIENWLSKDKIALLKNNKLPVENLNNPVLLTYLKNLRIEEFSTELKTSADIIDKYFNFLLTREQTRQNITLTVDEQILIFESVAKFLFEMDVKSAERDIIKELILSYNTTLLKKVTKSETQDRAVEELANTLSNHALLDRVKNTKNIGFINDLVYGYMVGLSTINTQSLNVNNKSFKSIELLSLCVDAFKLADNDKRNALWENINKNLDPNMSNIRLILDTKLLNKAIGKYENAQINSEILQNVSFSLEQ